MLVARLSNLVILTIALIIMVNLNSIQTAWQISLLFGAGTGAVLVMRWLWERVNLWCEVGAIVASLLVAPVLIVAVDDEWLRLLIMSAVSVVVLVAAAYLMPGTSSEKLLSFYRKVRPPGFWRRTAEAGGEDVAAARSEFRNDLLGLLACAVSVYCWLTGFGRLLLQSDPFWLSVLLVLVGFAAIPFWLRSLRAAQSD